MHDELTAVDIQKMKDEINERVEKNAVLKENLRAARELGDLSENDEYRTARRELGRNNGRIAYLTEMIKTAVIIKDESDSDKVGLFDKVTLYYEDDDETSDIRLVTTLRNDVLNGYISKESPLGLAIMGKKAGDRVPVHVNSSYSYYVVIKAIEKCDEDLDIPISSY